MKLASIERIHSITTHPNADSLLCAKVLEWPVVVKKDAGYKDNDFVVFIYPDVIVDAANPEFAFMERAKWRVWQARFRGEPSAGLVMPCSILPSGLLLAEGDDVGEMLKLAKYERPLDVKVAGQAKSNFPSSYISISDEDNLRSYPKALNEFRNRECYISVKQDGSSFTAIRHNEETHICSRRLSLKEGDNAFWQAAKKYCILENLNAQNLNYAIQGELCGPKLNGNKLNLSAPELFIYKIVDLNSGNMLGLADMRRVCNNLGLKTVPIYSEFVFDDTWDMTRLTQIADSIVYPNGAPGEGIVIRPCIPVWSPYLSKNLSVKLINQNYKQAND